MITHKYRTADVPVDNTGTLLADALAGLETRGRPVVLVTVPLRAELE